MATAKPVTFEFLQPPEPEPDAATEPEAAAENEEPEAVAEHEDPEAATEPEAEAATEPEASAENEEPEAATEPQASAEPEEFLFLLPTPEPNVAAETTPVPASVSRLRLQAGGQSIEM